MSELRGGAAPDSSPSNSPAKSTIGLSPLAPHTQTLGRYTTQFRVASGGMATVYVALFRAGSRIEKRVALKIVHPHLVHERGFIEMFLDEARIVSRLNHPNVCSVFDSGEIDGAYYLAMEYLHGVTLADLIRESVVREQPNLDAFARIVADAARGLHAAHEIRDSSGRMLDLIHRDVSPQNIFVLADGIAKVLDFGIAQSRDRLGPQTEAGQIKGKLGYMAPEQLVRQTLDRRADIFALGIVLWEATLGRRLFKRDSPAETIAAITSGDVPAPRSIQPDYPEALEKIVLRALRTRPAERFETADQMARELDSFVTERSTLRGPSDVADYVRSLFGRDLDQRMELVSAAATRTAIQIGAARSEDQEDDAATEIDSAHDWKSDSTTTAAATRILQTPAAVRASNPPAVTPAIGPPSVVGSKRSSTDERTTIYTPKRTLWLAAAALVAIGLVFAAIGALLGR